MLSNVVGNKRQKISQSEPDVQDTLDSEMQGISYNTAGPCVHGVRPPFITCVLAEAASPLKVTAGSASDYSSWGVQQLMKLYYGENLDFCTDGISDDLMTASLRCRPTVSTSGYIQMASIWQW